MSDHPIKTTLEQICQSVTAAETAIVEKASQEIWDETKQSGIDMAVMLPVWREYAEEYARYAESWIRQLNHPVVAGHHKSRVDLYNMAKAAAVQHLLWKNLANRLETNTQ